MSERSSTSTDVIGRIWRADQVAESDFDAFLASSILGGRGRIRLFVLVLVGFNLVFWLTDSWMLADVPTAWPAMAEGRLAATVLGVVVISTSWLTGNAAIAWGWLSAIGTCVVVSWTLGRIGGPGTPWFHFIYPFMFLPLLAWMRFGQRVLFTLLLGGVFAVCYFGPNPHHLRDPLLASSTGSLFYMIALSILLGGYLDRLRLRLFLYQRRREAQMDELAAQVDAQTRHIRMLLERVETAQENERRELAVELHDEMGQALTGLRMMIRIGRDRAEGTPTQAILDQASLMLQHATRNLRAVLERLRPRVLDDLGLGPAVEWLTARMTQPQAITHQVTLPPDAALEDLPEPVATAIYRVVQEALTNAIRHAQAACIEVALSIRADRLEVVVIDDGVGFEPESVDVDRLGLLGMAERARAVGGTLQVEAVPGRGTRVNMSVPLLPAEASR